MNDKQLQLLKEVIDNNLEIRGINVDTKLEYNKEKNRFNLTSTNFQTFPVIHFDLSISDFVGKIFKDENETRDYIKDFYIEVDVKYHGNMTGLFTVRGKISEKVSDNIFVESVNHRTK